MLNFLVGQRIVSPSDFMKSDEESDRESDAKTYV
jgi:hypothetical protein